MIGVKDNNSPEGRIVPLDTVLCILMDAWSVHLETAASGDEKRLVRLTRDFDDDGDGVLDFNEFCKLVKNGIGGFDEMLPLYEEVLNRTQEKRKAAESSEQAVRAAESNTFTLRIPDAIDPHAFAEVVARRTRLVPPGFYAPGDKGAASGSDDEAGKADALRAQSGRLPVRRISSRQCSRPFWRRQAGRWRW